MPTSYEGREDEHDLGDGHSFVWLRTSAGQTIGLIEHHPKGLDATPGALYCGGYIAWVTEEAQQGVHPAWTARHQLLAGGPGDEAPAPAVRRDAAVRPAVPAPRGTTTGSVPVPPQGRHTVTHPAVRHPRELLAAERAAVGWFNTTVSRVASSVLGSMALFWVTFLVPLLTLPASDGVKLVVSIVFSSWFQAWALPVLQNAANRADAKRDAKADADHAAQVHIATVTDHTNHLVRVLAYQLGIDPDTGENRLPRPRY
jgi:hypothetical protein